MEKVFDVLNKEGWTEIQVFNNRLTGVKDGRINQALIVNGIIDFNEKFEFLLIPYEDEFLVYKVTELQGK
jgi:hypothetical protein